MAGSFCLGLAGFLTQHDDFKAAKKSQLGPPFPFSKNFSPTHTSGKLRLEDDHAYKKIYDLKVPLNFSHRPDAIPSRCHFLATVQMPLDEQRRDAITTVQMTTVQMSSVEMPFLATVQMTTVQMPFRLDAIFR